MFDDKALFSGSLDLVLINPDGSFSGKWNTRNMLVDYALSYFTRSAAGLVVPPMTHVAVGIDSTTTVNTQTTLVTEVARDTIQFTTVVSSNATNDSLQYVATIPAGQGTGLLTEAGIFDAAVGGNMMARAVFTAIDKAVHQSLVIVWRITAGAQEWPS